MNKRRLKPFIIGLMLIEFFYVGFWSIGAIVISFDWWPRNLLGIQGYNILAAADAQQMLWLYTTFTLFCLGFYLMIKNQKLALPIYLASILSHMFLWMSLMGNPYTYGEIGFIFIFFEVVIAALMVMHFEIFFGSTPEN